MTAVLQPLLRPLTRCTLASRGASLLQLHSRNYCTSSRLPGQIQPPHAPAPRQPDAKEAADKLSPAPLQIDIVWTAHHTLDSLTAPSQADVPAEQPPDHHQPKELGPVRQDSPPSEGLVDSTGLQNKPEPTPQVLVLWDLDNQPLGRHPVADAVDSLRFLAMRYGKRVKIHAFANRHAFIQVISLVPSKSRKNKPVEPDLSAWDADWETWGLRDDYIPWEDQLGLGDHPGLTEPQELRCYICGAKQKTEQKLTKHIKSLHARERQKKLKHIASVKSVKKKDKLWKKHEPYLKKFALGSARMADPESMGLEEDLKQAGVEVHLVADAPEAADGALRRQLKKAAQDRVDCVFLVSDDKGFEAALKKVKKESIKTVVVGRKKSELAKLAHASFIPWDKVLDGSYLPTAISNSSRH